MPESSLRNHFVRDRLPRSVAQSCILAAGITLLPIAMLLFNNRGAISAPMPIFTVAVAALLMALGSTAALSRLLAPHAAAAIVGAFGYGFFSMSWVGDGAGTTIIVFLWIAISGLASSVLLWLLSDSRLVLNIATVVTSILCVGMFGSFLAVDTVPERIDTAVPAALAFADEPPSKPNVYMFVLDAFGRPEVLAEQFAAHDVEIDLSSSITALEDLGFVEDQQATSNYTETILSVASTLNGTLHHTPEDPLEADAIWTIGSAALQGDNALVTTLNDIGYDYWHSSSGIWDASACNANFADICLGESISSIESNSAVWSLTPLHRLIGNPDPKDISDPTTVAKDVLAARATQTSDTPYFMFAHVISPHQPYRFDRACNPIDPRENGSTLTNGHFPRFRQQFADQAVCLGTQLEAAMSQIIDADPTAIIILQADHGPAFEIDFGDLEWNDTELTERFSIFRMTRMPERCRSTDASAHWAVNTAPLVVACVANRTPQFVEGHSYLTSYNSEFGVVEVELPGGPSK